MISKSQIRLIHLAKDRLGLSYEDYHEILMLFGNVYSSKDLDAEGFFSVMEHFRELGFHVRGGPYERPEPQKMPGTLIEMATPGQRALIRHLEYELGWAEEPDRLERFMLKRLGIRRLKTKAEAIKVIEALKAMAARMDDKDKHAG